MAMMMAEKATSASDGITFDTFFESNYEQLLRVLFLVTGNRHEAEDLAQEAFVKLYERWDRVRGIANPAGYLYRTALNANRSRLRRVAVAARNALARRQSDEIDASDDRDAIRRALDTVPNGQREAIVLVEWLDMTDGDAAAILGITPVAVRVRISRAKQTLRATMRGETNE